MQDTTATKEQKRKCVILMFFTESMNNSDLFLKIIVKAQKLYNVQYCNERPVSKTVRPSILIHSFCSFLDSL